jgi:hypothetical protein
VERIEAVPCRRCAEEREARAPGSKGIVDREFPDRA